jgi:hypothetical protein
VIMTALAALSLPSGPSIVFALPALGILSWSEKLACINCLITITRREVARIKLVIERVISGFKLVR